MDCTFRVDNIEKPTAYEMKFSKFSYAKVTNLLRVAKQKMLLKTKVTNEVLSNPKGHTQIKSSKSKEDDI